MRIHVTQAHIDKGLETRDTSAERECNCPVALAILEQLPGCVGVFVTYSNVGYSVKSKGRTKRRMAQLPESAIKFIREFDAHNKPAPRSFNIPLEA